MRLIDADAFEQELKEKLLPLLVEKYGKEEAVKGLHFSLQDCISNIQGQPTATQPEIIRCKDCIYYRWEIDMCDYPYSTAHNVVHEYDFCSKAERRTDEH